MDELDFIDAVVLEITDTDLPSACRHGKLLACHKCNTAEWDAGVARGRQQGLQFAIEHLKTEAGLAYAGGRDSAALELRFQMRALETQATHYEDVANAVASLGKEK
jgi:hypothetical protein